MKFFHQLQLAAKGFDFGFEFLQVGHKSTLPLLPDRFKCATMERVKLLERLPTVLNPTFLIRMEEEDLAALATVLHSHLEKLAAGAELEASVTLILTQLALIMEQVGGEDGRWFAREASKIRKHLRRIQK